ncbi:class I SAM-dependent methyltransferase [Paraglaciecola aquimarina]|uniref:Class I SAM-dependent methyltransferase n=1 Tax=Paraglaciecola aquimarina TaxID=1235557 RepID=A0ABU3STY4_9ALTE|nr:class I SAM-dependent methyltransferase [Paraglaciecola aquimarina]MDU0353470.1 class I SAM-dependent methyltransferase [Paraglaciecola aquimarina]
MNTVNKKQVWVRETKFGDWFLNTDTWIVHVLRRALNDLQRLFPAGKPQQFETILDIGTGFGHSLLELDSRFSPSKIIALDVDPDLKIKTAEKVQQCQAQIDLLVCNAAEITLPANSVDMIFCHQTFHHIVDQESAIQEFYRVLKPGGCVLFAESCRRYIHSFIIKLLFRHPMSVQKTDMEYLKLIKDANFLVDEQSVSRPFLWWSREDLGIWQTLTGKVEDPNTREETLINAIFYKPCA